MKILFYISVLYFIGVGIAAVEIVMYSKMRKTWVNLSTLAMAFLSWIIVLIDFACHLSRLLDYLGNITIFDFREKK